LLALVILVMVVGGRELWAAPGDVDGGLSIRVDGAIEAVAVDTEGKILLGGNFFSMQGVGRNGSARLSGGGVLDQVFNPNVREPAVRGQTVLDNGNVLVMGDFSSVNGVGRGRMAQVTAAGALVASFNPDFDAAVLAAVVREDGRILVGGPFSTVSGVSRRQLARLNPNGSLDTTFNVPANNSILTMAVQEDGAIVMGGMFTTLGGAPRNRLARLTPGGRVDARFAPDVDGAVFCAAVQADGKILIGGAFGTVDGVVRRRVARLQADGSLDLGFNPDLTGGGEGVFSILPQCDGRIIFSGNGFTAVAGAGRTQVARVDRNGVVDATFNPLISTPGLISGTQRICAALQGDGRVLIAGSFGLVNGEQRDSLARLENDPATGGLAVVAADLVEWRRGGSAPEVQGVDFALSMDGARTWTALGAGVRVAGGWALSGLALPATGQVRARARVYGGAYNSSVGWVQAVEAFVLPTRKLAVFDGVTTAAPRLSNGQAEAVDFGETRQGVPVVRAFTLLNDGTADLMLTGMTVPTGYRIFNLPALPRSLGPGSTLTLPVQLTAGTRGTFAGALVIESTAEEAGVFQFPVAGQVTAPEIEVYEGAEPVGLEVVSGQQEAVSFGRNVQASPGARRFTLRNAGTAPLQIRGLTVPAGYELVTEPSSLLVEAGGVWAFEVRLTTLAVGMAAGTVVIENDDADESSFFFPVAGEVFIPAPKVEVVNLLTVLNRQTGLREQTIRILNRTTATVPTYRLLVRGLPVGTTLANATEVWADGTVALLMREPMLPMSEKSLILEYASATRQPVGVAPELEVEVVMVSPDNSVEGGLGEVEVERIFPLADGGMLLEFASTPGSFYSFHYSSDSVGWKESPVVIQAAGNRTQWIDRGPPLTELPPGAVGARMYRVREVSRSGGGGG
jgi:uncharacterized delta-60 repeat protein